MVNEYGVDLRALADGDEDAFRILHDRYAARLYRAAARMLGRPDEAEDAVQDTFLGIVRSRRRLLSVEDLTAYLFSSLRNAAGRRLAERSREEAATAGLREAARESRTGPGIDPEFDTLGGDERLARALRALPAEQREVVALKIDGGLTFAEISRVLGVSINTAASRYRYALERLREGLED